jgi:glycosyltransferase involved in cell wall biosynthesis
LPHIVLKQTPLIIPSGLNKRSAQVRPYMANDTMSVVFLIRKNPGSIGGIQRLMNEITDGLSHVIDVERIVWHGPDWAVPCYLPYFYYKAIKNRSKLVHCDDAVTALIGAKIRANSDKKVVASVHGLDVILPIPLYQEKVKKALVALDKIICISRATAKQVIRRGIDESKIKIIPPVAEIPSIELARDESLYQKLEFEIGLDLRHKKVLLSLGRPVARKGFDRFITDVFVHLPEDFIYLVAGPKPNMPAWMKALRPILGKRLYHNLLLASGLYNVHDKLVALSTHPRVFYMNGVSDTLREMLLAAADLFIMPNRTVEGDMEGFGLVALEASSRGVPVVATGIEGIKDAVIDGQNGFCVNEGDSASMLGIIMMLTDDPLKLSALKGRAIEFTRRTFSPEIVFSKYVQVYDEVINGPAIRSHAIKSALYKE